MIINNYSLKKHNTFGLDVSCDKFVRLQSDAGIVKFLKSVRLSDHNYLVLGSGSNILFSGDYSGYVLHAVNRNIEIIKRTDSEVLVYCEAGVIWDDFVKWCVEQKLGGLENLSLIPGTVGASPVQNIGAYGVEAGESIAKVSAINIDSAKEEIFTGEECKFGYRDSIFKRELTGRYIITGVTFRLIPDPKRFNLTYGDVEERVLRSGQPTLERVRNVIISIRKDKLPDPNETGNAGSFFKNPVVGKEKFTSLINENPDMPYYSTVNEMFKIPAAWMIDSCGLKGTSVGDASVHQKQPLVLVNRGKASGKDILELAKLIENSVSLKFGISLSREVMVI